MPANYQFGLDLQSLALINKGVGANPRGVVQFQATDGIRWLVNSDSGSDRVSLLAISGTDGIVSSSVISSFSVLNKTVGANPRGVVQFQATDGIRWLATAENSSNRISLLAISGTDGIVSSSVISSFTLLTKTVGTAPQNIIQFQATDGVRWLVSSDSGSDRVSLLAISGTDGIVSSSVILAFTLLTKTVGSNPMGITQFQATDGVRWLAVAGFGSNQISLLAISGTDGIVSSSVISAFTLLTKTVGAQPNSVVQFQATDGVRWCV